jgi:glycosyltransferase involved in cell wall biosynthesis
MNIGFDAKRAFLNATGLGVYSRNLILNFVKLYPQNQYFLFSPKIISGFAEKSDNLNIITPDFKNRLFWRTAGIAADIRLNNIDIYHGLSNEIPLVLNPKTKYITTIHDTIWLKYPNQYSPIDRKIYSLKFAHACKKSKFIVATSEMTARDIEYYGKIKSSKIKIIYQSGNPILKANEQAIISDQYLLYISSFETRKNHLYLIHEFSKISKNNSLKLILAGKPGNTLQEVKDTIKRLNLENKIILLESVTEQEKATLLKHCLAFIYPSLYEGFGIPLLEAMQQGCKLILNELPVFKEIARNKALYFDATKPGNLESLFTKKFLLLKDNQIDYKLELDIFSAKKTSEELNKIYLESF